MDYCNENCWEYNDLNENDYIKCIGKNILKKDLNNFKCYQYSEKN